MTHVRTREWSSTDYYAVLGIEPGASGAEVDARYRSLAKVLHPDTGGDPGDEERFKRVSGAYAVLRDPTTRGAYDEFRRRVAEGRLVDPRPQPAAPSGSWDHLAPPRVPKQRRPMPAWLRTTLAALLTLLGIAGLAWAVIGGVSPSTNADTPLAVQITLLIMAVKLLACAGCVYWYPQLRARWMPQRAR